MSALPKFLMPRLRLFLSADIVGSTGLKQTVGDRLQVSTKWFTIIQAFYTDVQQLFLSEWASRSKSEHHVDVGLPPEVWKVIGDEIVFVKVLSDHRQASIVIQCWISALKKVRNNIKEREPRLDVKCTAWTAGFPLLNKEVVVWSADSNLPPRDYFKESGDILEQKYDGKTLHNVTIDYIGPSIDIGFRLTTHATPRKFVLSAGVAYILSLTSAPRNGSIRIGFDGAYPLKGVFGGTPYPIFWVDMADDGDISLIEDRLAARLSADRDTIAEYCAKFFSDNAGYTFPPFIDSDDEPELNRKPDRYDEHLAALAAWYRAEEIPDRKSEEEAEKEVASADEVKGEEPLSVSDMDAFARSISSMISAIEIGRARKPPYG